MESFQDRLKDLASMSDEELARLMEGGSGGGADASTKRPAFDDLAPGERVKGTVLDFQGDEILVEIDRKTLGIIDQAEFADEPLPLQGAPIQAEVIHFDRDKDVYLLTVKGVRSEVAWDDLRKGMEVEGKVVEATKGGLVIDLKGVRAFLPVSHIELHRVEAMEPYIGQKLRCEIQDIDRAAQNVVLSRRAILERERSSRRQDVFASLKEGDVRTGKVVRLTEHGAFVNLGDVDGLIHTSRIREQSRGGRDAGALKVGQTVEVVINRVEPERGRISLDFRRVEQDSWEETSVNYKVGDVVTGWVTKVGPEGTVLSLGEGIEGLIPTVPGAEPSADFGTGSLVKGTIASIDKKTRRIVVKPK
jgi:ribosomal protein S1